jgi:hypothetical protein
MSASPASSSATTVQHVVSQHRPATSSGATPVSARTRRTEVPMPSHQSLGFCSAYPGSGWVVSYGVSANPTGAPVAISNRPARMPPVPPSTPSTYLGAIATRARRAVAKRLGYVRRSFAKLVQYVIRLL